jgi:undecaprenyl phosphate-alpha-L-ara4N flippase subunit ArnE
MTLTAAGILLVVLCTVIEGFAQVFLKKSANPGGTLRLWLALGTGLFVVEALIYTGALRLLDVSTAYPIGSLSFVAVTVLSHWLLKERITAERWVGVGLIIAGATLVAARA